MPRFSASEYHSPDGGLSWGASTGWGSLDDEEKRIVDFVLKTTSTRFLGEFVQLVHSTYPVSQSDDDQTRVDLVDLARRYKASEKIAR